MPRRGWDEEPGDIARAHDRPLERKHTGPQAVVTLTSGGAGVYISGIARTETEILVKAGIPK
jgi:hypothetical protein